MGILPMGQHYDYSSCRPEKGAHISVIHSVLLYDAGSKQPG